MSQDIETVIKTCDVCATNSPSNAKEPMIPHEVPTLPWKKLGADIWNLAARII